MTPAIIERLKDAAPLLKSRVYGAAALAALMAKGALPNVTPCAHVVPTGLAGRGDGEAATGAFVQSYDYLFDVVLSLKAHDPLGERLALDEVQPLILEIAGALTGWTPNDDTVGVFAFRNARIAAFSGGIAHYVLTFSLQDQLRIAP